MIGKYELNKIYCEDSYEAIKKIPDNSVDLIMTDPPYLIENTNGGKNNGLGRSITNTNNQLEQGILTNGVENDILTEMLRIMKKPNIYIYGVTTSKYHNI